MMSIVSTLVLEMRAIRNSSGTNFSAKQQFTSLLQQLSPSRSMHCARVLARHIRAPSAHCHTSPQLNGDGVRECYNQVSSKNQGLRSPSPDCSSATADREADDQLMHP